MQQIKQNLIIFIACLTLFLAALGAVFASFAIKAETAPPPPYSAKQFNAPKGYFYFDEPTSLFASDTNLYVAQKTSVYDFSLTSDNITSAPCADTVKKIAVWGNKTITLVDDLIKIDDVAISGTYADFSLASGMIFAIFGEDIIQYNIAENTQITLQIPKQKYKKIAAYNGGVYLTVSNANNSLYDDIFLYTLPEGGNWALEASGLAVEYNVELQVASPDSSLIALTQGNLVNFKLRGNSLLISQKLDCLGAVKISANSEFIYALTSSKKIVKTDFLLNEFTDVYASENSSAGYYNLPSNIISKKGIIAIADEFNNRVLIITPNQQVTLANLHKPKAVAIDNLGNIFVADYVSEINKYSQEFILDTTAKLTSPDNASIKDMKFDSNDNLYVLCDNGTLYKIASNTSSFEAITLPNDPHIIAFDILLNSDNILFATTDKILQLGNNDFAIDLAEPPVDFCVDHDNSVYVLTTSANITKYSGGSAVVLPAIANIKAGAASIVMNTFTSSDYGVSYGDILVTDTVTHSVKFIESAALEVNKDFEFDTSVQLPDVTDPPVFDSSDKSRIIFSVKDNCSVYAGEAEIYQLATLSKNLRVIIPQFDKTKKFNFIIADNLANGKDAPVTVGYVLTSRINIEALEYTADHPENCHTYVQNVSIYAYPTRNSPKYANYSNLAKNTQLKLLDFCYTTVNNTQKYGYTDNFTSQTVWYKVMFGEQNYVGYVPSDFISVRGANPDMNIYPQTNAKIISKDKQNPNVGALAYSLEPDGSFIVREDLEPIAVGTSIEVVGAFDTSKPYTKIKYLTTYGTIEVWVDTLNIAYDGVNVVQIVAIVIIIATMILLACLVIYRLNRKRNTSVNP